jgi:hypothetical protein
MRIEIDVIESPDLERMLRTGEAVVADELVQATEESLAMIEGAIKAATPVGVAGALRGATMTEVRGSQRDVTGRVFNPLGYSVAVEQGSRPHTASLRAIEQWAKRKLGANAAAAYRIWRSIRERGTAPHAFFAPGLASVQGAVLDRFAIVPDRVTARLNGGPA